MDHFSGGIPTASLGQMLGAMIRLISLYTAGANLPPKEAERLARLEYATFVGAQLLVFEGKLDAMTDIRGLYDEMLLVFLKYR